MKIIVDLKKIIVATLTALAIIVAVKVYNYMKPVNEIYYRGMEFEFRDNIKDALRVPVYPDDKSIHDLFWKDDIGNVTILFKPVDAKTNGYYKVEGFEIAFKLSVVFNSISMPKNFSVEPIESYNNIPEKENTINVVLVPPGETNETSVRLERNTVFVNGKDYRGFDLATMKFILVVMDVNSV